MNYYFLLEDEKPFIKVLPEWLKYMGIQNTRVQDITYVRENNYVMQSGGVANPPIHSISP